MNIDLHIEKLVLRGLNVRNRADVAQTVQRELVRLLSERGLPNGLSQNLAIRQVRGPGFQVSQAGGDERLAGQVAQSTYGALSQ